MLYTYPVLSPVELSQIKYMNVTLSPVYNRSCKSSFANGIFMNQLRLDLMSNK